MLAVNVLQPEELDEYAFVDESEWVVAASRRAQPIALAPAAVSVLSGPDFVVSPAITLPDLLRYQTGVDVYQSRHGQFEVGLRGFSSPNNPRTLALYDGREFRLEQVAAINWVGRMHQSDINRVEIVKGPASVSYGANAFGGVISISSNPYVEENRLSTFFQVGNNGLLEADATVSLSPNGSDSIWQRSIFKFSAGASERNDLDHTEGSPFGADHPRLGRTDDTDLSTTRFTASWQTTVTEDIELEALFGFYDAPEWDLTQDYVAGVNAGDSQVTEAQVSINSPWGTLSHRRTWSKAFISNQKIAYGLRADFWYFQVGADDVADKTHYQITKQIGEHHLIAGAEHERVTTKSNLWGEGGVPTDDSTWAEVDYHNTALFAEDQWLFADHWAVTGGVRIDNNSIVDTNVSPRLALNYQPDPSQFYRASLSSGYRLPNSVEQFLDSSFFAAAEDLGAETIQSIDVGWQKHWENTGVELGVTTYYSRANDLVTFLAIDEAEMSANWDEWMNARLGELFSGQEPNLSVAPSHFFEYTNLNNPLNSYGIELASKWSPPHVRGLDLWANITWANARHEKDIILQSDGFLASGPPALGGGSVQFQFEDNLGKEVNTPPEWKLSAGGLYRYRNYFFGGAIRFVDERSIWSIAYSDWDNDVIRTQTIDSYFTMDLSAGFFWGDSLDDPQGSVKISAMNLLDAGHYESHKIESETLITGFDNQYTSEVPLSLALTVTSEF